MRVSVLAGLLACTVVFVAGSKQASAAPLEILQNNDSDTTVVAYLSEVGGDAVVTDAETTDPSIPVVVTHTVVDNETLSDIAKKYETTWKRIYDKNTDLENPDVIKVGDVFVIPAADEQLEERALPQPPVVEQEVVVRTTSNSGGGYTEPTRSSYSAPASSSGNLYVAGYCTWYVKNRRPDLPNNLGNAYTWVSRAAAQGMSTGSTPVVGAVGQQGNHVVYIEAVHGDGTVTVSEMNWSGWNVVSTRTVAASNFTYIY